MLRHHVLPIEDADDFEIRQDDERASDAVMRHFKKQPTGRDAPLLNAAIRAAGAAPKHLITDRGVQFFPRGLPNVVQAARDHAPLGRRWSHKSIAIIERFWRSMKDECCNSILIPLQPSAMQSRTRLLRSGFGSTVLIEALQGTTPNERAADEPRNVVRFEPRPRMPIRGDPESVRCVSSVELRVTPFAGKEHLPVVEVEAA
ncbi:MAG: hypothetical protein R3B89_34070 [Polyangiaceae bacterium]